MPDSERKTSSGCPLSPTSTTVCEIDVSSPVQGMAYQTTTSIRMTNDGRPFSRDLKRIFSLLVLSLPLSPHRVRFHAISHTFTSKEAIQNLGSLTFVQSYRIQDPKDPSRTISSLTTTTCCSVKESACSICQKFLEAGFIKSANNADKFSGKNMGAVWRLTQKGVQIVQQFYQRYCVNESDTPKFLTSPQNPIDLVLLERDAEEDQIKVDQVTIDVIFRWFARSITGHCDSNHPRQDSKTKVYGRRAAKERRLAKEACATTFTGKSVVDWVMQSCSVVSKEEAYNLARLFYSHNLIHVADRSIRRLNFSASKDAMYKITGLGQQIAGWVPTIESVISGGLHSNSHARRGSEGNTITAIIHNSALRLLFRNCLRRLHCEENLAFCLDFEELLENYSRIKRSESEEVHNAIAAAYNIYNTFLAPGSPSELNIDYGLSSSLITCMVYPGGDSDQLLKYLDEVIFWFDRVHKCVLDLMAKDSVPKFIQQPKLSEGVL